MKALTNLEMIMWLRGKMNECEEEIMYLEEVLVSTVMPAGELIKSLNRAKSVYEEYKAEYNRHIKIKEESRNG